MRPCLRKEGKTLKGLKQPDGKGIQHTGAGGGLHNALHFIVQYIINMLCGLRESTEKVEVPESQLDLSRASVCTYSSPSVTCRLGLMEPFYAPIPSH